MNAGNAPMYATYAALYECNAALFASNGAMYPFNATLCACNGILCTRPLGPETDFGYFPGTGSSAPRLA